MSLKYAACDFSVLPKTNIYVSESRKLSVSHLTYNLHPHFNSNYAPMQHCMQMRCSPDVAAVYAL